MATPTQVTVEDPHVGDDHGGDGHASSHEEHMLVGHDGQMHPSNLRHYFVSSEQQFEASKLGMWLFLATEILLFGGMFVAYGIFRVLYPELYEQASMQLDTALGAANTLVLLLSSLTMAWAIRAVQMDNRKLMIQMLSATILLASGFLVVKYFEYAHKFEYGIYPGVNFELNEGTQRVNDLTGAVPGTPLFVPGGDEEMEDVEAGEADAGTIVTGDAPLVGDDQNTIPGESEAVPDGGAGDVLDAEPEGPGARIDAGAPDLEDEASAVPDALEATDVPDAVDADPVRGGAEVPQESVAEALAGTDALDGPEVTNPGEYNQDGLGTEHGEDHGGREDEIFSNRRAGIFFAIYYMMTGIHALHIIIGIIAIGFLVFFGARGKYSSVYYTPVENVGLYWHIVDIIWIFVFPLMYLI
ncbi:cytochrome c oxidase subunit 3 [Rubrivirga sp.]|uniref:cytochrome c oxidase subunit 3 n=1 Tax=Rubrivirga sp. TaxID=1885344 RepID=UPI003C76A6AE